VWNKVFSVYKDMRDKGIPCNTIAYNTLLDACTKSSSMSRASTLLEDMKSTSVEPDVNICSISMKGFCSDGDLDRACSIMSDMMNVGSALFLLRKTCTNRFLMEVLSITELMMH